MATKKLRIGLLIDTRDLLAWECVMLRRILNSHYAEIVLVVHNNTVPEKHTTDRRRGIKSLFLRAVQRMTYAFQAKLEDKVGGCVPYAFAVSDDLEQFRGIPGLELTPTHEKFSTNIDPVHIERIREFDVDVFIALCTRALQGDILNVAKYGVWSWLQSDNRNNRGNAGGFWEVFCNLPVTASTLQLLVENPDGGKVIGRTFTATCPVSVKRNRNNLYWKASFQLPRKLEELYLLGPDVFFAKAERNNEYSSINSNQPLTMPTLSDEIGLVFRIFWRIYSNRIRNFFVSSQWILLFAFRNEFSLSSLGFRKIIPPRDRFWADPHVLIKNRRYYVFIEELRYSQNKGY